MMTEWERVKGFRVKLVLLSNSNSGIGGEAVHGR